MITIKQPEDLARLRRIALTSQGLLQEQAFGHGLAGARAAINHIGYVQIDSISVIERAHHHVLYARVPDFRPSMTDQMLIERDIFEYWTHAAAFIPIKDYRFSLPYKHAIKNGQIHWYKDPDRKLMGELLARIRSDGALRSRDIKNHSDKRAEGWWDWKPAKKALEQLYMEGELMVSNREGFQKTYDLTENVLPAHINTQMPSVEEFATHLLDQQLRCHGLVSLKGVTYQRRNTALRTAVKSLVDERIAQGTLERLRLSSGDIFFTEAGTLERILPPQSTRLAILSPFDNSVIQRDRLKALFSYDYQIECYVPEAKRQYGYFSLPLLFGGAFIGRMDCKAHRKTKQLEIKSLHIEQPSIDEDLLITALTNAIIPFMAFQQCESVTVTKTTPKHLLKHVHHALTTSL